VSVVERGPISVVVDVDPDPASPTPDLKATRRERLAWAKKQPGWTRLTKSGRRIVAYVITRHYSIADGFFLSQGRIATALRLDRDTVKVELGKAVVSGLLVKRPRTRSNGSKTSNQYWLAIDAPEGADSAIPPMAEIRHGDPPSVPPSRGKALKSFTSLKGSPFKGEPSLKEDKEGAAGENVLAPSNGTPDDLYAIPTAIVRSFGAPSDEADLDGAWREVDEWYPGASRYRAEIEAYVREYWIPPESREQLIAMLSAAASNLLDGIEWAAA
jgi:hypothetical protein